MAGSFLTFIWGRRFLWPCPVSVPWPLSVPKLRRWIPLALSACPPGLRTASAAVMLMWVLPAEVERGLCTSQGPEFIRPPVTSAGDVGWPGGKPVDLSVPERSCQLQDRSSQHETVRLCICSTGGKVFSTLRSSQLLLSALTWAKGLAGCEV